jgi:ubiquitin-like 1-activating enzyme E1 A
MTTPTAPNAATSQLHQDATDIYDRQIRIWGMDVQRRLMDASVLVLGCTPLAAEVCKNAVLAGVGSMTLIDDTPADKLPMTFLTMHGKGGDQTTAATVFAAGLAELNPMVKVEAAGGSAHAVPGDAELAGHALVIAFGLHAGQQAALNAACRARGVAMLAAVSQGPTGYAFADLLRHDCAEKVTKPDGAEATVQRTLEYVPLAEAAEVSIVGLARQEQRQLNRFAGAWRALVRLEMAEGRRAGPADADALCNAGEAQRTAEGLGPRAWDSAALRDFLAARPAAATGAEDGPAAGHLVEFAPVNAIMGGLLANDVVRIVSRVGVPTHNLLFYSIVDNVAQVHNFTGRPRA